jgi:iron complex transport system ATP-binding protein
MIYLTAQATLTPLSQSPATILTCTDLVVRFGRSTVLDGVSLGVGAGEVVSVIGPNGSGKTTLIRAMLGFVKPASGTTSVTGDVGYLSQVPSVLPGQHVSDVLLSGRPSQHHSFGLETRHDVEVIESVAKRLELTELLNRPIDTLSGGQRQRAFVGRALASEPRAIVLDEPATFLDLKHQVELYHLLRDLCREKQLAVLIASHDLNLSAAYCDRIVVLNKGKLVADGAPREVLRAQLLSDVYGVALNRLEVDGQVHIVPVVRDRRMAGSIS